MAFVPEGIHESNCAENSGETTDTDFSHNQGKGPVVFVEGEECESHVSKDESFDSIAEH